MGSLERRLHALEDRREAQQTRDGDGLSREALRRLTVEELHVLEDVLEAGIASEDVSFENLYAISSEKSRRALDAYREAFEATREGREREPPGDLPEDRK